MSKKPETTAQPYFNIDPARAASRLGEAVTTERFAKAAAFCARGRDDLARRGYSPDGRKHLRKFSMWEVTRYLLPIAGAHLRRVLKAHPELPQGEGDSNSRFFTLEEVLQLRDFLAREGSPAKEYRPWRPAGLPAKICAVTNFKGGSGKTTTCAHLAMAAALDGYKVLVLDLDSQASMTSLLGGQVQ
ncbi:MAG: AAA family ATPase, partial [Gemmobacter sp.]